MYAIDVHGHYGNHAPKGRTGLEAEMRSASIEEVRARAQQVDIRLTVVSPLQSFHPYGGDVIRANEDAREKAERYDDIRFWAVLDPCRGLTYKQVEELLSHERCKGIKIHPVNHQYEIRDRGEAIFEFAADHQALVLTHSGCPGSYPEDFVPFLERFTEATLILAHLGNSADGNLNRQVCAIQHAATENLFVDTSSIKSMTPRLVEWAVDQIGAYKVLFGTDTPVYVASSQKARIEYADLSKDEKQAILFDNAARLLGEFTEMAAADEESIVEKSLRSHRACDSTS